MTDFDSLGISPKHVKALQSKGITSPTEIQEKTIPSILEGKDVLAQSATGSGKTLAFGLGVLEQVQKGKGIQALILTPTRELAEQIVMVFKLYGRELSITQIYGGVSYNPQVSALKKADIVVGTPGRVLDHINQKTINLSNIKHIVLDEADQMLDMGFFPDVTKIINSCPKERQSLLFSATFPEQIKHLSKKFMKDPLKVKVSSYVDPKKLHQIYYDIPSNLKFSLLAHLLKEEQSGLIMVFCNSRKYVDAVAKSLSKLKIPAYAIHGGLTQNRRNTVLQKFQGKKAFVLVCTDVAARGLDIPDVSHVYNYDIPNDSKQYVHRIGRTARAGNSGMVVNLISNRDHDNFSKVLYENDLEVKKMERPHVDRAELIMEEPKRRGFGGGRGRSNGPSRGHSSRGGSDRSSSGRPRNSSTRGSNRPRSSGPRSFGGNRRR